MSLINDALKRARETQRNNPPPGAPPLPPVESPARGSAGWILAVAAILFLAALGLFLGPTLLGHKAAPVAATRTPEISTPPPSIQSSAPMPVPATPPPAAVTNPAPAVVAAESLPRVQGIIFNSARPLAIVSGQTVGVGDRVGNYQVKQILKTSVVFQRPDGSQKTLGIGE